MPDQYGNPTEAELRGQVYQPTQGYTGNFTPNDPNISTRDRFIDGQWVHDERATPTRDKSANAPAIQTAFSDDPSYHRSDVAPVMAATNKDTRGKGHYGTRGWMHKHPLGVIGSMIAIAAGGAAASGAGGGPTGSDLGVFSNGGAGGMSGVGGGNAGVLANSGAIEGGAGVGGGASSMMGKQMPKMPGQQNQQPKNTFLQDELERQAKERELKKQIADELGPRYV